jgi:hypothetical protein
MLMLEEEDARRRKAGAGLKEQWKILGSAVCKGRRALSIHAADDAVRLSCHLVTDVD